MEKKQDSGENQLSNEERQKCEVWTRVMGYHRPVKEFNPGKQSEHYERKHYSEDANPGNCECCS